MTPSEDKAAPSTPIDEAESDSCPGGTDARRSVADAENDAKSLPVAVVDVRR